MKQSRFPRSSKPKFQIPVAAAIKAPMAVTHFTKASKFMLRFLWVRDVHQMLASLHPPSRTSMLPLPFYRLLAELGPSLLKPTLM
jgi:hypothetical protein